MATYWKYIYLHICDVGIIIRNFFKEINNLTHFDWNLQASSRPFNLFKTRSSNILHSEYELEVNLNMFSMKL